MIPPQNPNLKTSDSAQDQPPKRQDKWIRPLADLWVRWAARRQAQSFLDTWYGGSRLNHPYSSLETPNSRALRRNRDQAPKQLHSATSRINPLSFLGRQARRPKRRGSTQNNETLTSLTQTPSQVSFINVWYLCFASKGIRFAFKESYLTCPPGRTQLLGRIVTAKPPT